MSLQFKSKKIGTYVNNTMEQYDKIGTFGPKNSKWYMYFNVNDMLTFLVQNSV